MRRTDTRTRGGTTSTIIFAHILLNCGYANFPELAAMVSAWGNLYRLLRPGLIVFDHSPIALLAARGVPARKLVIGSGFCVPPDHSPLPKLRPWLKAEPFGALRNALISRTHPL